MVHSVVELSISQSTNQPNKVDRLSTLRKQKVFARYGSRGFFTQASLPCSVTTVCLALAKHPLQWLLAIALCMAPLSPIMSPLGGKACPPPPASLVTRIIYYSQLLAQSTLVPGLLSAYTCALVLFLQCSFCSKSIPIWMINYASCLSHRQAFSLACSALPC